MAGERGRPAVGEIITLIGSNGAGKSTTLRTVSGLLTPRRGQVVFDGQTITGMPGHRVVAAGICHAPEGRRIFPRMTVMENLEFGAFLRRDKHSVEGDLCSTSPRWGSRPSSSISCSTRSRVLDTIQTIREQGTTVLVVEQNALAALRVADYAYVLESGSLKLEGPARELADDDEVVRAYLGG